MGKCVRIGLIFDQVINNAKTDRQVYGCLYPFNIEKYVAEARCGEIHIQFAVGSDFGT